MRYTIVLIYPERFIYVEAFREIIEMLQADFAALGMQVPVLTNQLPTDGETVPILFGSHLLSPGQESHLPRQTILYNAEHLVAGNVRIPEHYYRLLAKFQVWDFNKRNVELIRDRLGNLRAYHMPLGYNPVLSRILPNHEDIDVLFYGIVNERRQRVLQALRDAGAKVVLLNGVFGVERDNSIARAKIVLNMHFDDDSGFESARVIPLLANRKAVVCEESKTDIPETLRDGMKIVAYEFLAQSCLQLLDNPDEREEIASRGFLAITEKEASSLTHLARQLGHEPIRQAAGDPRKPPRILMAGAGRRLGPHCVNADINPKRTPDWQVDFGTSLPFNTSINLGRHGEVLLRPGMFDSIIAHHLIEHIPDLSTAMANFITLLRDGGALHIEVPYDLSHGAWQDPTHVRAFNERSWSYFTEQHHYLDWQDARFDLVNLTFLLSPYGQAMRSQGRVDEEILRTPRAVDSMRVVLVRRSVGPNLTAL